MSRFSRGSLTVNARAILEILVGHGFLSFYSTEAYLFPVLAGGVACNRADVLAVFRDRGRHLLVGVEVKDHKAPLMPGLARAYLEAYRRCCEFFYLAGNRFSIGVREVPDIGLLNLESLALERPGTYLWPDEGLRASIIRRVRREFGALEGVPESPYQRSLGEYFYPALGPANRPL